MVRGINLFRVHFQHYIDYFTLISGTACELTLSELGGFRATRDMVDGYKNLIQRQLR